MWGRGEGATKKSRRLEKPRSPCYRKRVPFWGSWLRTQVSLSWRDELQRHGPRGIAGDCVAERKYRRGDLCSGARRGSNEAGYLIEQTLLSLPSVGSPHLGTHASRCWREHSSETRTPGGVHWSGSRNTSFSVLAKQVFRDPDS